MRKQISERRNFLKATTTCAAGFIIVPRHVLGGKGYTSPSDKVTIAAVGVGGRGKENVAELLKLDDVQVVAIADPAKYWDLSRFYYRSTAGRGPVTEMIEDHYQLSNSEYKLKEYEDFRKMLDVESGIDAILCATPDHLHAYVTLASLHAGKHVYCEKPLTHNIWEARMVQKVARETGLATQMGNQMHSGARVRNTVEYLRAGIIGSVSEVHCWVPASRWSIDLREVPKVAALQPAEFNWDLWLGPRSMRPFNDVYTPVTWRDFWDFGCGAMGDFGCHDMDAPTWGLELPLPGSVEVYPAGFSDNHIAPYGEIGYYQFPAANGKPSVKLTWYSGGLKPPKPENVAAEFEFPRRGAMYVGEKGIMVTGASEQPQVFPESLRPASSIEPTIPSSNGHHRDWVDAIKGGPPASSNFEYAAHLTEITLLGVLSLRMGGQKILWDAENMKARGLDETESYIRETVREGWEM